MSAPFAAIVLAGGIRPAPLSNELRRPPACLPIAHGVTLLEAWLEVLSGVDGCASVLIIVSRKQEADAIEAVLRETDGELRAPVPIKVVVEPHRWRGTGGIVRDIATIATRGEDLVVLESAVLPPPDATRVIDDLRLGAGSVMGIDAARQPAGVYAFDASVLDVIPGIGFYDVKEQLIPALHARGCAAHAVTIADRVLRIRDRAGYLDAVAAFSDARSDPVDPDWTCSGIDSAAAIIGHCLIDSSAVIESGALIDTSVILDNVTVRAGATVSRSIIGPGVEIDSGALIVDTVRTARVQSVSLAGIS